MGYEHSRKHRLYLGDVWNHLLIYGTWVSAQVFLIYPNHSGSIGNVQYNGIQVVYVLLAGEFIWIDRGLIGVGSVRGMVKVG